MSRNLRQEKFPGCVNVTVGEAGVWARVCKQEGETPEQTLETITLIDDLLTIQQMAPLINKRRGNTKRRVKMQDVLVARIMQADTITK